MNDFFDKLESTWRWLEQISAMTGLSAAALAGRAAAAYFGWAISWVRNAVIIGAILVVTNYGTGLYEYHAGRADVQADWDAAKVAGETARKARDADIAKSIEDKYKPLILEQQQQVGTLDAQVRDYEKQMLAQLAAGGGRCELGDDALRLRNGKGPGAIAPRRPADKNLRANSPRG